MAISQSVSADDVLLDLGAGSKRNLLQMLAAFGQLVFFPDSDPELGELLDRVPGLDHVRDIALARNGRPMLSTLILML